MTLFRLLALGKTVLLMRRHFRRLDAGDRRRLRELRRRGQGISQTERAELRGLLSKLGPREFAVAGANTVLAGPAPAPAGGRPARPPPPVSPARPVRPRGGRAKLDVLIVGAGLSGIGAACRMREGCPGKTFAILEARATIGGTWDLFRYPGHPIRLGHVHAGLLRSAPGRGRKAIADGPSILNYIRETAREHGVDQHDPVQPPRRARRVVVGRGALDRRGRARRHGRDDQPLTCGFLFTCTGYYRYDRATRPSSPASSASGRDRAPAAVDRRHRLRRQAGRRDRQRRDRRHPRPRDGGARRARHDAAAVAQLHRLAARARSARRAARRVLPARRLSDRAVEERAAHARHLPASRRRPRRCGG